MMNELKNLTDTIKSPESTSQSGLSGIKKPKLKKFSPDSFGRQSNTQVNSMLPPVGQKILNAK